MSIAKMEVGVVGSVRPLLTLLVVFALASSGLAQDAIGTQLSRQQHVVAFYSAWNAGDLDAAAALLGPETAWIDPRLRSMPFGGRVNGSDQIRVAVLAEIPRNWPGFTVAVDTVTRNGNLVLMVGTASGFAGPTGKPLWLPYSALWDIRDGNVRRVTTFFDAESWFRTLGD